MSKKNSNVLSLKSLINNDKRFNTVYLNFKKNFQLLKNKKFLVAVSGGPDSLALAAISKVFQIEKKNKVYYVLVNHGLRANAEKESLKVKKLLKKIDISLAIIKNKKKIKNNIQGQAREIRYKLLIDFCKKRSIKNILTAHHCDDQVETFFIRLSRGSGVQGLSSMKQFTKLKQNINLMRPFLDLKKKELIFIAKKVFGKYIVDPSNKDTKYLRTKIRKLNKILEKSGIQQDQIIRSIKNLSSTRDIINNYIEKLYKKLVTKKKNIIVINYNKFSLEKSEIQLRLLSNVIKDFSKSYYPPRSNKVLGLLDRIHKKSQNKQTLNRCIIEKTKNFITVKKEH